MDITSYFGVSAIFISILLYRINDNFARGLVFNLWIILVSFFFPRHIAYKHFGSVSAAYVFT